MEINDTLHDLEVGFNTAGGIPIVALFSGGLRVAAAKIQVLAGLVVGAAGLIGQIFSNERKWEHMGHKGVEHVIHGALNMIRGIGEVMVGMTIVGSLLLLLLQFNRKFEPIYQYEKPALPVPFRGLPQTAG